MAFLLSLLVIVVLVAVGVVIGVHNANSSTLAPIAKGFQSAGNKAVKSVSKPKRK